MLDWINSLMQPGNMDALASKLAQTSAPPPLEALQRPQAPQMSQVPGAPGSFAAMLEGVGAPGRVAGQAPAPQMTPVPGMPQPNAPIPMASQGFQKPNNDLLTKQVAGLAQQGQQAAPHYMPAASVAGGSAVRDPQMLTVAGQAARPSLAQLIYGR